MNTPIQPEKPFRFRGPKRRNTNADKSIPVLPLNSERLFERFESGELRILLKKKSSITNLLETHQLACLQFQTRQLALKVIRMTLYKTKEELLGFEKEYREEIKIQLNSQRGTSGRRGGINMIRSTLSTPYVVIEFDDLVAERVDPQENH